MLRGPPDSSYDRVTVQGWTLLSRVTLVLVCALLCACTSSQGGERQGCYPNGSCNAGLTCLSDLCVASPDTGMVSDAAMDLGTRDVSDVPTDVSTPDTGTDAGSRDVAPPDTGTDAGSPDVPTDTPAPPADVGVDVPSPADGGTCMPCVFGVSLVGHCCLS